MGYEPYLNEKDAAFDRDAQNLMDYSHGYDGGYINQGYSNVASLPSQMQLAKVIETRYKLNELSKGGRKEAAIERGLQQDEDQFNEFSNDVRSLPKDPEARAAAMQDMFLRDPSRLRNRDVMEATRGIFETDKWSLEARDNILKKRDHELKSALLDEEVATLPDRIELNRKALVNGHAQADLTLRKIQDANTAVEAGDQGKIGAFIADSDGFTEDERERQDQFIVLADELTASTNPADKQTLKSIVDITGSLSVAAKLRDIHRAKIGQHSGTIQTIKSQTGVDLAALPEDRAAQLEAVGKAQAFVATQGAAAQAKFDDLMKTLALSERTKGETAMAKEQLFGMVDRINELRGNPSPEAQRELRGQLAILRARGQRLASHYNTAFEDEQIDLKRREKESQIDRRYEMSKAANQRGAMAEEKMSLEQRKQAIREKWLSFGTREDRAKFFDRVLQDGTYDAYGFDEAPSLEQFEKRINEYNPIPGAADIDY